jgi:hypothetical protein
MKKFIVREIDPRPFESIEWKIEGESAQEIWDRFFVYEEHANTGVEFEADGVIRRTVIRDNEFVVISIEEENDII